MDGTQKDILAALRHAGCLVSTSFDICDLVCRYGDRVRFLDCDGGDPYRKRDPKQLEKFARWGVVVVKTPLEALDAIGAL